MRGTVLAAVAATALGLMQAAPAVALTGPAEAPPADFAGAQYVDSEGCVFVRAGFGGKVMWVPRVGADRKPVCGYPPSLGASTVRAAEVSAPAADPATAVPASASAAPVTDPAQGQEAPQPGAEVTPAVALAEPAPAAKPAAATPPKGKKKAAAKPASTAPGPRKIGCYMSAPVPVRLHLRDGGSIVVCTRGDGTLDGWRPPIYPEGSPVGASIDPRPVRIAAAAPATQAATSVARAGSYVQVGAFAVPANAEGAASRLAALGYAVNRSTVDRSGRTLQLIYAGPFASGAEAAAALSALRGAGFADAYLR